MLSVTAQDTHSMWEEELKSRSKLGVRLSELDREKTELLTQVSPVNVHMIEKHVNCSKCLVSPHWNKN